MSATEFRVGEHGRTLVSEVAESRAHRQHGQNAWHWNLS